MNSKKALKCMKKGNMVRLQCTESTYKLRSQNRVVSRSRDSTWRYHSNVGKFSGLMKNKCFTKLFDNWDIAGLQCYGSRTRRP